MNWHGTKLLLKIYGEAVSLVLVNATRTNWIQNLMCWLIRLQKQGQFLVVWGGVVGGKGQVSGPPVKSDSYTVP